jgi:hypothetical protein
MKSEKDKSQKFGLRAGSFSGLPDFDFLVFSFALG